MAETSAGNTGADGVGMVHTDVVVRTMNQRLRVVIHEDITPFEVACLTAFLVEYNERHTLPGRWRVDERLTYYGLERFVEDADDRG